MNLLTWVKVLFIRPNIALVFSSIHSHHCLQHQPTPITNYKQKQKQKQKQKMNKKARRRKKSGGRK